MRNVAYRLEIKYMSSNVMQLWDIIIRSSSALSFEQLKIGSGFALYQTPIDFKTSDPIVLKTPQLRDRGIVFVDEVSKTLLSNALATLPT